MIQMFSGTVRNAVKLNTLTKNFEQKKNSGNLLMKQELNRKANMTPEEKLLNQFKTQMENDREQKAKNELANKVMRGEDLTPQEQQYLARSNPGLYNSYKHMKEEEQAYEEKLRQCKTKDEVQKLKTDTMCAYLSELKSASGEEKSAKAMEIMGKVRVVLKAEAKFVQSGEYAVLPTEAEELEESTEEIASAQSKFEETEIEETDIEETEFEETDIEETSAERTITKENAVDDSVRKDEALEEIIKICNRYIPKDSKTETKGVDCLV